MHLEGSCHCKAVTFTVDSPAPYPYNRCYCSICRKTAGSGGFAILTVALAETLKIEGEENIAKYNAKMDDGTVSPAERCFCRKCGSQLWLFDPNWPVHLHPHASVFDTPLPRPPEFCDNFVGSAAPWVVFYEGDNIERLEEGSTVGMEEWHRQRGLHEDG